MGRLGPTRGIKRADRSRITSATSATTTRSSSRRAHEDRTGQVRQRGRRLLVGTSYGGGTIPKENVVRASDFLLLHGNGVSDPQRIAEMVRQTRKVPGYRPVPILFNEDDHFDFDRPECNFTAAIGEYASWGYFDYR
jgi:hypothetical protein